VTALRVVRRRDLDAYRPVRDKVLELSRPVFRTWLAASGWPLDWRPFSGEQVWYHAWRPGFAAQPEPGWEDDAEPDLDGVVCRAVIDFGALQNPTELRAFLAIVQARRPRTIVEIGTAGGGVLFALAQLADPAALLVSIDIGRHVATTAPILRSFLRPEQRLELIHDRSQHASTRRDLEQLLGGRGVDLLFIDGDHSYGAVRSDHEMYAPLCAPGGLVVFHDIVVAPENSGRGFDVALYWDELRARGGTRELVDATGVPGLHAQDGVPLDRLRPMAFGIGLVEVA
jgi:predicted O-methyltransferase YrrM